MSDNSSLTFPSNLTSPSSSNLTSTSSNLTSPSPPDFLKMSGGLWFHVVSGLIDHTLGIPANGWSLLVIVTSGGRSNLVESEIITLSLVAIETVSSLSFLLWCINTFFIKSIPINLWIGFLYGLVIAGRPLFQSLICLERYLAVLHPVVFLRYKPLRYRLACCGLVLLLSGGYGGISVYLFFIKMNIIIAVLALSIPLLSVNLFCSLSILRALKQPGPGDGGRERGREKEDGGQEEEQKAGGGERGKVKEGERAVERGKKRLKEERKNQQKRRAFRMVSFMLGMLVFNYAPLMISAPLRKVFEPQEFNREVFPVVMSFSKMGNCIHALLHLHRAGRLPCLTPTTRGRQQNN